MHCVNALFIYLLGKKKEFKLNVTLLLDVE